MNNFTCIEKTPKPCIHANLKQHASLHAPTDHTTPTRVCARATVAQWSQMARKTFAREDIRLQLTSGSLLSTRLSNMKIASIAVISAWSNLPHFCSCAGRERPHLDYFIGRWGWVFVGAGTRAAPPTFLVTNSTVWWWCMFVYVSTIFSSGSCEVVERHIHTLSYKLRCTSGLTVNTLKVSLSLEGANASSGRYSEGSSNCTGWFTCGTKTFISAASLVSGLTKSSPHVHVYRAPLVHSGYNRSWTSSTENVMSSYWHNVYNICWFVKLLPLNPFKSSSVLITRTRNNSKAFPKFLKQMTPHCSGATPLAKWRQRWLERLECRLA